MPQPTDTDKIAVTFQVDQSIAADFEAMIVELNDLCPCENKDHSASHEMEKAMRVMLLNWGHTKAEIKYGDKTGHGNNEPPDDHS